MIRGEHRNREGQCGDNEGAHRDGEARVKPVRDTAARRGCTSLCDNTTAWLLGSTVRHSASARTGTGC